MGRSWTIAVERKCKQCGKVFAVEDASRYAYKEGCRSRVRYFCSWGCLCAFRKTHEKPEKLKGGTEHAI